MILVTSLWLDTNSLQIIDEILEQVAQQRGYSQMLEQLQDNDCDRSSELR